MSDEDYSESVMIAYPSAWPADYDKAHCTILYFGEFDDLSFTRKQLEDALKAAGLREPDRVPTNGIEMLGENKDVPVVLLESLRLRAQHAKLKLVLKSREIEFDDKWPDHKPHVTVPSKPGKAPLFIELGKPRVYWGGE